MPSRKNNGFSLLELMITVSLALVMVGVTFIYLKPQLNQSHMNSAYDTTLMALRNTRNLAITQSHEYYVNFNPAGFPAGTIQVEYQPPLVVGALAAPPIQQVNTYTIPGDVTFNVQAGFPAATPDGFGAGLTAIDFESTPGVPLNYVVFFPDGSAQDSLGNYSSGVVYRLEWATVSTPRGRSASGAPPAESVDGGLIRWQASGNGCNNDTNIQIPTEESDSERFHAD
jgi:prepilin-type N-terminal cleavage/methylation domain-containing protein